MVNKGQIIPLTKTLGIVVLAVTMVVFPQEVLGAATQGVWAWTKYVLPALLPFFILSELLMGAGFVHLTGVLLEPVMRPVFRLPGTAAFVVVMGFTSGSPIGAVLTSKLYREKLLTRMEAERLIAFTNNASPGFMLGAVAAGMFGRPGVGLILAFANYLANLLLGIGLRFYGIAEPETPFPPAGTVNIWRRAYRAMVAAQRKDGRPFGQLIGDGIRNSVNTILVIGGFILFFSVLLRLLGILGVITALTKGVSFFLRPLGLDPALYPGVVNGLFEITLGAKAATQVNAPLNQQILLTSAIIAWSGFSVHAQVASFISNTGIRFTPFFLGRFVHVGLAAVISASILHLSGIVPAFVVSTTGFALWQTQLLALLMALVTTLGICLITTVLWYVLHACVSRIAKL